MLMETLSRLYSKALQFLGMSSIDYAKLYFPEAPFSKQPICIEAYCRTLQSSYKGNGSARIGEFVVVEVNCLKMPGELQHEYISVKVLAAASKEQHHFYLTFDRGRGDVLSANASDPGLQRVLPSRTDDSRSALTGQAVAASNYVLKQDADASSSPSNVHKKGNRFSPVLTYSTRSSPTRKTGKRVRHASLSSSRSSSTSLALSSRSSSKPEYSANDIVTLQRALKIDRSDGLYITFDRFKDASGEAMKGIPLFDFAVLALTVHERYKEYRLTSSNCYYFVAGIMSVLTTKYRARKVEHKPEFQTFITPALGKLNGFISSPLSDIDHSRTEPEFVTNLEAWMRPILDKEAEDAAKISNALADMAAENRHMAHELARLKEQIASTSGSH